MSNLDAEIPDGAFELRVPKQELNGFWPSSLPLFHGVLIAGPGGQRIVEILFRQTSSHRCEEVESRNKPNGLRCGICERLLMLSERSFMLIPADGRLSTHSSHWQCLEAATRELDSTVALRRKNTKRDFRNCYSPRFTATLRMLFGRVILTGPKVMRWTPADTLPIPVSIANSGSDQGMP